MKLYNARFWAIGGWFTVAWIGVGVGVLGLGANLLGQSQQADANEAALQANKDAQTAQNNNAWSNYLMTRGIAPTNGVTAGVIPTAGNYQVVNSRLPLWATVNTSNGPKRWVKAGTPPPANKWSLSAGSTGTPTANPLPTTTQQVSQFVPGIN